MAQTTQRDVMRNLNRRFNGDHDKVVAAYAAAERRGVHYRSDMTLEELYEAARGEWVVGPRRERVDLALAVSQGIVPEVYRVRAWHPAGTLAYRTRGDVSHDASSGRWEFEGDVAEGVRDTYVGFSVGKGGQDPIRYVNV